VTNKNQNQRPLGHNNNGIPLKALVADDEFNHRRLMVQLLKSIGFNVTNECINGEEALHYISQVKPDIIFLDYHMPRMVGLTTLNTIKATLPDAKVILCTTETDKSKVTEILKLGAIDYIVKPIDRIVVLKKLARILRPDGTEWL
jgi:two-component system chemotaxis response regulator CheY